MKEQTKVILVVAILLGAGILLANPKIMPTGIQPQAVSYTTAASSIQKSENPRKNEITEKPNSPVTEICKQTSVKAGNKITYSYTFNWRNMKRYVGWTTQPSTLLGRIKISISLTPPAKKGYTGISKSLGESSFNPTGGKFYSNMKDAITGKSIPPGAPGGVGWFKDASDSFTTFRTPSLTFTTVKGQTGTLNFKVYVEWAQYAEKEYFNTGWKYQGFSLIAEDNVALV